MRESFTLRLGTCRRSGPLLRALFVSPAASIPARPRPRGLPRAQSRAPADPGRPGASSPFSFPLKQPRPPAILCPAPFSVRTARRPALPLPRVWSLLCPQQR